MRNVAIACWTAVALASCAPGGPARDLRPNDPTVADAMGSSCLVPEDYGNPLIVDWNPEQRGNLEVAMKEGVVVVAYDCDTLRVLPNCSVQATYGFMGMNRKEQVIRLENADEIKANLPTTGGKLGGGMERGSALDVALVMVGKMMTTRKVVSRDALEGDCGGATHFVRGATVGAFATRTGTSAKLDSAAQFFGAGAETSNTSSKTMVNRDGDLGACKQSTPDSSRPPQECSALLRLNLAAIAPTNVEIEPEQGIKVAHEECPKGFRFDGAKCTRLASDSARQCKYADVNDCVAQCRVGHPGSCNNAGTAYFRGDGVRQDYAKAAKLFEKSCQAGFGMACFNFGYMQVEGVGIPKDVPGARRSFRTSCDAGEAGGCSELGWMLLKGFDQEPDYERSHQLFANACSDGFPSGCVNLAYMYSEGLGVKKDYERALAFNAQGCDGGSAGGCSELALMYTRGWGARAGFPGGVQALPACVRWWLRRGMQRVGVGVRTRPGHVQGHDEGGGSVCALVRSALSRWVFRPGFALVRRDRGRTAGRRGGSVGLRCGMPSRPPEGVHRAWVRSDRWARRAARSTAGHGVHRAGMQGRPQGSVRRVEEDAEVNPTQAVIDASGR